MVKELKGGYRAMYVLWRIQAPYSHTTYIYAGAKTGAKKFAERLYKQKKFNYKPSIREIRL